MKSLVSKTLEVALNELGKGEFGGNNWGPDVFKYRKHDGTGKPVRIRGNWCASFISYCFRVAANATGTKLPFKTSRGAKRLGKNLKKAGWVKVDKPEPGAIIIWDRGVLKWQGHIGICTDYVEEHSVLVWVDGNGRGRPSKVALRASKKWQRKLHEILVWRG